MRLLLKQWRESLAFQKQFSVLHTLKENGDRAGSRNVSVVPSHVYIQYVCIVGLTHLYGVLIFLCHKFEQ